MTNIIGGYSNTIINQQVNTVDETDVKNLVKYLNGETLNETPDTFVSAAKGGVSSAGLFVGLPFANFLRKNKISGGKFISDSMKKLGETNKKALDTLLHGEGKITERIAGFMNSSNNSNHAFSDIKSETSAQFKEFKFKEKVEKAVSKAAKNPSNKRLQRAADKLTNKAALKDAAKLNTVETAAKSPGVIKTMSKKAADTIKNAGSKIMKKISPKTMEKISKLSGKLGKADKIMKSTGAKGMLIISGILELATEVAPTFKELGFKKGMKQLGKSALTVVGDTAGFIAGEQIGISVGTAIGTVICPGIGTAIGAAVGFAGGIMGSFFTRKITDAITGPSERELAKQEEQNQTVSQIISDETKLEELKNDVTTKIQEELELNNGELSEDSLIALEILENMTKEENTNPFESAA